MGAFERNAEHSHNWQLSGEMHDDVENTVYTKWACPCGAFKIIESTVITDEADAL